jgi:hypothetical protein
MWGKKEKEAPDPTDSAKKIKQALKQMDDVDGVNDK